MKTALSISILLAPLAALAGAPGFTFPNIDGGAFDSMDWRGRPVLVINTASRCGYTGQMNNMQRLHERYGPQGLVVLAAPSDDFRQELDDAAAVKAFCEANYGLTVPMTDLLHVARAPLHPFYAWLEKTEGFTPDWNFNKVLLDGSGEVVAIWGAAIKPDAPQITEEIEQLLERSTHERADPISRDNGGVFRH